MAKYVKDTDLGLKAFMREMQNARTAYVTVGIHQGARNNDGTDIAEYAAANEYGTEDIPSRPFMRTSFDENIGAIQSDMNAGMDSVKQGGNVYRALSMIGLKHQTRIQNTVKDRDFLPKLAESTIKAKRGSTKTLIDSGALVNSVRYVVHSK